MMMGSLKILEYFAAPSGMLFAFLLTGIVLLWTKDKIGKVILTLAVLFYYIFSINTVSVFFLSPLERPYRHRSVEQEKGINTAVLLSGGEQADVLRASALLELYQEWKKQKGIKRTMILSGTNPIRRDFDEAGVIRDYLVERGIPSSMILLDRKSLTTRESSQNLKKVLGDQPFLLVTSAYHMTRSLEQFSSLGMRPVPLAADFKIIDSRYFPLSAFPSGANLGACDIAFHEYEGILFYKIIRERRQLKEKLHFSQIRNRSRM